MIKTFQIKNQIGDEVTLIDLGARVISWHTLVADETRNIIVGYENIEDYYYDTCYVGAVAGPYANRIDSAKTNINGSAIKLNANEGKHHLHGGRNALDTCFWQVKQQSERAITFSYWVEDGFNGYPGAMSFEVEYRLAENTSQLKINFHVVTDKPTIIGPTGHAYFNLAGTGSIIDEHKLQVNSEAYTELNEDFIPTGKLNVISKSKLDFQQPRVISNQKIDHNFLLKQEDTSHAILTSPCNSLSLVIMSDYPASQVYTGDYLSDGLSPRQGICIEPQFYPDSPNKPNFPFELTTPEKPFNKKILYKLEK